MKNILLFIATVAFLFVLFPESVKGQIVGIKKWKDTYPEMNDSYPLSFIAFKGKIIPVPHIFIRMWPTHYYVEVGALPVTDSPEIAGQPGFPLYRFRLLAVY